MLMYDLERGGIVLKKKGISLLFSTVFTLLLFSLFSNSLIASANAKQVEYDITPTWYEIAQAALNSEMRLEKDSLR